MITVENISVRTFIYTRDGKTLLKVFTPCSDIYEEKFQGEDIFNLKYNLDSSITATFKEIEVQIYSQNTSYLFEINEPVKEGINSWELVFINNPNGTLLLHKCERLNELP